MKKNNIFMTSLGILAVTVGLLVPTSFEVVSARTLPEQALIHMPVCPPGSSDARCHARVVADGKGKPVTNIPALTPADLHQIYNLPTTASTSQIIAIVDAYDNPNIKADLDFYSNTYGLPVLPECSGPIASSSVPCFSKVDQNGGTTYPSVNSGWALEIALDVEVAHAICQNCSLLLVEANSSSYDDLMAAFDQAVAQGAKIISNSYGSREFSTETTLDSHFAGKLGYAITFSSGDAGYGVSYPAASPYVTAVGGTTLSRDSVGNYTESAWSGAGSGCSLYETKPGFQTDPGCANRTVADVSAVADPNTGVAVYSTTPYNGVTGWFKIGGTSLSAPLIAGVYALAGGVPSNLMGNAVPYSLVDYRLNMNDVKSGSNGNCSTKARRTTSTSYLCTGVTGYDGPTGLGTPNTPNAF